MHITLYYKQCFIQKGGGPWISLQTRFSLPPPPHAWCYIMRIIHVYIQCTFLYLNGSKHQYIHTSEYLPLCHNATMFRVWVMDMEVLSISTSDESEYITNNKFLPSFMQPSLSAQEKMACSLALIQCVKYAQSVQIPKVAQQMCQMYTAACCLNYKQHIRLSTQVCRIKLLTRVMCYMLPLQHILR